MSKIKKLKKFYNDFHMCFRFLQYHDIYKKIFNIKYIYNVMKYKLLKIKIIK